MCESENEGWRHLKVCVRMRGREVGLRVPLEHEIVLIKVSSF